MRDWRVHDFGRLTVYQRAVELAATVVAACAASELRRQPVRRAQLERAAESIHANIAEGSASGSDANFARFLQHAIGSAAELQSHLSFAKRLRLLPPDAHDSLAAETIAVRRMLIGLQRYVRRDMPPGG